MLIRLVRMYFKEESVPSFIEIFEQNKEAIKRFPGCTHLQLMKDVNDSCCYTTLSHWNSHDDLENYRHSALFQSVWKRVKVLHTKKTEAYSFEDVDLKLES